jgi:hypothetical protein
LERLKCCGRREGRKSAGERSFPDAPSRNAS